MPVRSHRLLSVLFIAVCVTLAGCASHPATAPATATQPKRIVSLDSSSTEILFAIGAGRQVVAVDKDSDYPASVPKSSLDATKPNVEAIAAYHPDLVITGYDTNGLVSSLRRIGVRVLLEPAPSTVDGAYSVWTGIGRATGHLAAARRLVASTQRQLASIVAAAPHPATPLRYYYELDQTYYTATSHTFIGALLGRFGMTDIADPADTKASGGYPQLSAERVLAANPQLVFLADSQCCGQNAATVAARPGWAALAAVHDGGVVALNDDIASRWGPRIVDLMRTVSAAITRVTAHAD
ncbi:MAG TPA: ABC transporter substrate-binding protein [Pseudonocardiaceae bacterium]|nr:ABC transporter substrate-binding protein [Pseudonocardiaceae bacterium]